jgi:Endopolygalacturonase
MTNTYLTGNPLGSTSPKDLYDNASNFDEGMNSTSPAFYDRFRMRRQTWAGMQKQVVDFLEAMGFEAAHLTYVDGTPLTVLRPTQLIDRGGITYKVKQPATFPVALTGTWATDQLLLVDMGDVFTQAGIGAVTRTSQNKMRDIVSVKDFGAVGDGVTDDAASIQAAITYCLTTSGGSKLVFPKGTYALGSQVNFPKTVDTTMTVVGDRAVIKRFGSYTGTLFYFGEVSNTTSTAPTHMEGFIFSGPYLTPDVSPLVKLQHSNGTIIEKCVFQSGTIGLSLEESYAVRVIRCQFAYQKSYGVATNTPCMNLLVDSCQFSDIAAGQSFGSDINFAAITHNINIVNSDFEGGRAAVLSVDAVNAFNFVGNYIEGKTALPFFLGARSRGVKIECNWIGYNSAAQTWYNITGGSLQFNIFWDQVQAIDMGPDGTQCIGVDVGSNVFNGTSTVFGSIWTNPVPINGFTNVGAPYPLAGYHQSADGRVDLRGMVTGATDNSCIVLPVGLRPPATMIFPANGSTRAAGNVTITSDGNVTCFRSSNGSLDLSCVSFYP